MRYMEATTKALQTPKDYVTGVLNAPEAGSADRERRP
jgi:hypothetical protein